MASNTEDGIRVYKDAGAAAYPNGVKVYENKIRLNTQYAAYFQGDNLDVYRNEFNGRSFIHTSISSDFYNNVFYLDDGAWKFALFIQNARINGIVVKNNILVGIKATDCPIGVENTVVNDPDINYNLHYSDTDGAAANRWDWKGVKKNFATWKTDSGMDANSVYGDPLFVDATDFVLGSGSPAIDIGTDMGLDYLGDGPDAGANERE
jgi:hypothetical protein